MGFDRYKKTEELLSQIDDDFDVKDCFSILKAVSQEVCPTIVSMVLDVNERKVYWCVNREYDNVKVFELHKKWRYLCYLVTLLFLVLD